jgi:hypothetical protein
MYSPELVRCHDVLVELAREELVADALLCAAGATATL